MNDIFIVYESYYDDRQTLAAFSCEADAEAWIAQQLRARDLRPGTYDIERVALDEHVPTITEADREPYTEAEFMAKHPIPKGARAVTSIGSFAVGPTYTTTLGK